MERFIVISLSFVSIAALLYIFFYLFRYLIGYEIREKDVLVRLFHFLPIYKIRYEKIIKMHVAPVWEVALIPGVHLFTRPFAKRVVIELKDQWTFFNFAFLTPDDPDAFISEIKKHLANFSE